MLWMALGFSVTVLAAMTLPNLFGYRSTDGADRQHAADPDGRRHVRRQMDPPDQARPGDIVTFKSTERGGKLVTHRVRSIEDTNGTRRVVTKGDANDTVERWSVPANGRVSRVELDIPKVGYVANWSRARAARSSSSRSRLCCSASSSWCGSGVRNASAKTSPSIRGTLGGTHA